jgi:hypothetical protein
MMPVRSREQEKAGNPAIPGNRTGSAHPASVAGQARQFQRGGSPSIFAPAPDRDRVALLRVNEPRL